MPLHLSLKFLHRDRVIPVDVHLFEEKLDLIFGNFGMDMP